MVLKRHWMGALALALAPVALAAAGDGAVSLVVTPSTRPAGELLDNAAAWAGVPDQLIHLNRTPPLYEGDPLDDGHRPSARVNLVRSGDRVLVRLTWSDSTESRPAPPERIPDAGADPIYLKHSLDIERFADAACVMVPKATGENAAFPGIMMGDRNAPVDLYYWNLVKGFERMEAAGRATTSRTGQGFPGRTQYAAGAWVAVFELPAFPAGTPLCFAVWDGDRGQRDGLKYYSLWYDVGS